MGLHLEDQDDFVNGLFDRPIMKDAYVQDAQTLRSYVVMRDMLQNFATEVPGGKESIVNVALDMTATAEHTGSYATAEINVRNVLQRMHVPWRTCRQHLAYDIADIDMETPEQLITSWMKPQTGLKMVDMAREHEDKFWQAVTSVGDDDPYPVTYWVVKNSSRGFNGGHPSGYSDVGGISRTTYPNHKNYTFTFDDKTESDMVYEMRYCLHELQWRPPVDDKGIQFNQNLRIYTTLASVLEMEDIAKGQNDRVGFDLYPVAGRQAGASGLAMFNGTELMFRRTPVLEVPYLTENASANEQYWLDLSTWRFITKSGWNPRRFPVMRVGALQPTARVIWWYRIYKFMMISGRRNAVGYEV